MYLKRNSKRIRATNNATSCPYYDDLYLDIIYGIETGNTVKILDEDELLEALKSGQITQQNYELAYSICSKLTSEIKEKRNVLINMDKKQVIKKQLSLLIHLKRKVQLEIFQ